MKMANFVRIKLTEEIADVAEEKKCVEAEIFHPNYRVIDSKDNIITPVISDSESHLRGVGESPFHLTLVCIEDIVCPLKLEIEDNVFNFEKESEKDFEDERAEILGIQPVEYIGIWKNITDFIRVKVGEEEFDISKTAEGRVNITKEEAMFLCLRALNDEKINNLLEVLGYGDEKELLPTCRRIK